MHCSLLLFAAILGAACGVPYDLPGSYKPYQSRFRPKYGPLPAPPLYFPIYSPFDDVNGPWNPRLPIGNGPLSPGQWPWSNRVKRGKGGKLAFGNRGITPGEYEACLKYQDCYDIY